MPQSPTSGEAKSAGDSTADNRGGAKGPTADLNEASSIGFVESPDDKKLNAGLDKSRQGGAGETDAAVAVKVRLRSLFVPTFLHEVVAHISHLEEEVKSSHAGENDYRHVLSIVCIC